MAYSWSSFGHSAYCFQYLVIYIDPALPFLWPSIQHKYRTYNNTQAHKSCVPLSSWPSGVVKHLRNGQLSSTIAFKSPRCSLASLNISHLFNLKGVHMKSCSRDGSRGCFSGTRLVFTKLHAWNVDHNPLKIPNLTDTSEINMT